MMDCVKSGRLISRLRREKGLTQKELAEAMHLSDRTISKWERGAGCPDVSLLPELSALLGVNIEKILSGDLRPNAADRGNMKKIQFYVCPDCGNILFSTGESDISCCGRKLPPLAARPEDERHQIRIEKIEDDYYIALDHEMSKQHYITFIAYVCCDRVLFIKLYPEQSAEARFPQMHGGRLYVCCSQDGLMIKDKV